MRLHEPIGDYYVNEKHTNICLDASGWPVAAPPHVPWWKLAWQSIQFHPIARFRTWLHRDCGRDCDYDDDNELWL